MDFIRMNLIGILLYENNGMSLTKRRKNLEKTVGVFH